jgi:hypothetical protein
MIHPRPTQDVLRKSGGVIAIATPQKMWRIVKK